MTMHCQKNHFNVYFFTKYRFVLSHNIDINYNSLLYEKEKRTAGEMHGDGDAAHFSSVGCRHCRV
jgi:hypothetical protein